ncbi:MAG: FAD-dependent oxidoreductase [Gemmataceae bacterium]|nr:FAD-dependent oxidoreductase [Gemmataceae bacterium]
MRAVVIGAGVVGVACAHYLRRAGASVVLLDQGRVGGGCSHANCGYVCPSHVLPLAGPHVLLPTLRTLLQRNSPLAIRLSAGPSLWAWLLRFAWRCRRSDMLAAGHAIQALLVSSRSLYDGLALDADWQSQGLLFVFHSRKALDHYAHTDALLRREFGLGATRHGPSIDPALRDDVAGAYRYATDAQVRPDRLMASWKARLLADGVEIREGVAFQRFTRRSAVTDQGDVPGDVFVVATGAWTPQLSAALHHHIPVQPGKGYSVTMARPALCPRFPMIFEEHRVAVSPFSDACRLGSTMEFAGYDERLDRSRLRLLHDAAKLYLRTPPDGPPMEEWWGWRPMIPDGKPAIGFLPKRRNVIVAAGHGMLGLSMAPATGKLVAELALGEVPHLDPAPYSVTRF